jgi:hypothetical protein
MSKILDLLSKVVSYLFQYWRDRPNILVSLSGIGFVQGAGRVAGNLNFIWRRTLLFHNDSQHLARGIKLVSPLPEGWTLYADVPTRIEADRRIGLEIKIETDKSPQELVSQFGKEAQSNFGQALLFAILTRSQLKIEFRNQHGRTFHLVIRFDKNGNPISVLTN